MIKIQKSIILLQTQTKKPLQEIDDSMVEDTRCSEQGRCQVGGEAARKIKRGQKIEKQGQKLGNWRKKQDVTATKRLDGPQEKDNPRAKPMISSVRKVINCIEDTSCQADALLLQLQLQMQDKKKFIGQKKWILQTKRHFLVPSHLFFARVRLTSLHLFGRRVSTVHPLQPRSSARHGTDRVDRGTDRRWKGARVDSLDPGIAPLLLACLACNHIQLAR